MNLFLYKSATFGENSGIWWKRLVYCENGVVVGLAVFTKMKMSSWYQDGNVLVVPR